MSKKVKNNKITMYGSTAMQKDLASIRAEEEILNRKRGLAIEKLKTRFFDFLKECFDSFKGNGVGIYFKRGDAEIKLFDVINEYSYWVIFKDELSQKEIRYLVHALASSCTIMEVYEKIQKEIIPIYEENKKIFERERTLKVILNNNCKVADKQIKEKI